jgi:hypothetical protein
MKKILIISVAGFMIYWLVWTLIFIWFVGLDFKYYWHYFRLSWWNPGEIPALIRFYSFLLTIFLLIAIVIAFFLLRKLSRR